MAIRRVRTTRVEVSSDRGVFMISVAAELAEMHPQTLRMYEARGLIEPKRSPKGTRLYSHADVDRLRRIQEMTAELGMNLAGVERVFELEEQLQTMARKVAGLEKRAKDLGAEVERLEAVRRELRAEIVPYVRGGELIRHADLKRIDWDPRGAPRPARCRFRAKRRPVFVGPAESSVCNDPSGGGIRTTSRRWEQDLGCHRGQRLGERRALSCAALLALRRVRHRDARASRIRRSGQRAWWPGWIGARAPSGCSWSCRCAPTSPGSSDSPPRSPAIGSPMYGDYPADRDPGPAFRRLGGRSRARGELPPTPGREPRRHRRDRTVRRCDDAGRASPAPVRHGAIALPGRPCRALSGAQSPLALACPAALGGRGHRRRRPRHPARCSAAPGVDRRERRPIPANAAPDRLARLRVGLRAADRDRVGMLVGDRRSRLHAQSVPDGIRLFVAAGGRRYGPG